MAADPQNGCDRGMLALTWALAALATAAAQLAILEPDQPPAPTIAIGFALAALAAGVGEWSRRGHPGLRWSRSRGWTIAALAGLFLLPLFEEGVRMVREGWTQPLEIVTIASLRNLVLGLAAAAWRAEFSRLAALASLFLVVTASALAENGAYASGIGAAYAVLGSVWLILRHWRTLQALHHPNQSRRFPAATVLLAMIVIGLAATAGALGPAQALTMLRGFVPSSGGTDWNHEDARSGVNDGDNEVKGSERPESVGFTDSEVYLDTDRPSLYDAFNDMYGEPIKPKKQERMIALTNQNVKEQEERPSENLRAGRQFSAIRKRPTPSPRKPGDRAAQALLYVKGQTPLHLGLAAYDQFDGREWTEEPPATIACNLEREPNSSWLRPLTPRTPVLSGTVSHQIKIGLLDSSAIVSPSCLSRFRVGSVDRPEFFGWSHEGMMRMIGRTIPAGTVIDTEALTVDADELRSSEFGKESYAAPRFIAFEGRYVIDPAIAALAESWTEALPRGWAQIDAVVAGLRRHAVLDRDAPPFPDETRDAVGRFLLIEKRGPDYLFASSAVVMLRSLGYPARLVSGFYAAPEDYDPLSRHTPVRRENVHFWAEVRLPCGAWITIEPTPGYQLMGPVLGPLQTLLAALRSGWAWTRARAVPLSAAGLGLALLFWRRREALDALATLAWRVRLRGPARVAVSRTLRLLERRSRWAGCPRPIGLTPRRWYGPIARMDANAEAGRSLHRLLALADWSLYAPHDPCRDAEARTLGLGPERDAQILCQRVVRDWTLGRFRDARLIARKESST